MKGPSRRVTVICPDLLTHRVPYLLRMHWRVKVHKELAPSRPRWQECGATISMWFVSLFFSQATWHPGPARLWTLGFPVFHSGMSHNRNPHLAGFKGNEGNQRLRGCRGEERPCCALEMELGTPRPFLRWTCSIGNRVGQIRVSVPKNLKQKPKRPPCFEGGPTPTAEYRFPVVQWYLFTCFPVHF